MGSLRFRRIAAPLLLVAASACLLVGDLALYASRDLFDSDRFGGRAASALREEPVRGVIGDKVADRVVEAEPDLIGGRPLIRGAVEAVAGTAPLQQLFRLAVADLHRSAFGSEKDTLTLELADVGVLVVGAVRRSNPQLAKQIPAGLDGDLASVSGGGVAGALTDLAQIAEDVEALQLIALVLAVALFAAAIIAAPDRRLAVRRLGVALAVVGTLVVAGFEVGRALVAGAVEPGADRDAARLVFDAFLLDLRTWNLVLAAAGVVTAAAAASLLRPEQADAVLRRAWALVSRTPATPWRRGLRAALLVAVGVVIVAEPDAVLRLALLAAGILVAYVGAAELLRMSLPAKAPPHPERRPARPRLRRLAPLVGVPLLLLAGVVALAAATNEREQPPTAIRACNGALELCDRTLDRVAFPATHNSMSAADQEEWLFAQHERGIRSQLAAGVRSLLIDTHYGVATSKGVYTVLQAGSKSRAKIEDELGRQFVETAERLRSRLGYRGGGKREVYLCHGYCETGALKATTALGWVRDFLVANPHEVLVLSVEDDVSPPDTERVFRDSGLLDYVYQRPVGQRRFPTLREMIESGQRVLVLGENETGNVPWYRPQFSLVQETPFDVKTVTALASRESCRPNRGAATNPILMLNNWVDTAPAPRPSNARRVNAYHALLRRARTCERIRRRRPGIVAVDFYARGDVVGVAQELNGVRREAR